MTFRPTDERPGDPSLHETGGGVEAMMGESFLYNSEVRRWLGGVEPAWTVLDRESLNALRGEPSHHNRVLCLSNDLSDLEIAASAVTRNALIVLARAANSDGLKLTATGNLSRTIVAELIDLFEWPGFDRTEEFRFHKVVNEPDFLPLYFVRHVVQFAKFVRPHRGGLRTTRLGKEMLTPIGRRALQALLFHITFWRSDLTYLGRGMHGSWPQRDIGIVLWSLAVAAADWQTPEKLTRLCTIPVNEIVQSGWDSGSLILEARILQPLLWFGLLEYRLEKAPDGRLGARHFYRKTPMFDRFLRFNVHTEMAEAAARH